MLQFPGKVLALIEGKNLKKVKCEKYKLVSSLKGSVSGDTSCFHQCVRELNLNLFVILKLEEKNINSLKQNKIN